MSKKIRAGNLRHIIIIQRKTPSQDTQGGEVDVWVNLEVTRASINPVTGRELYADHHIKNEVDHDIIMRYTDITPADRIIYKGRIFDTIRALDHDERKRHLTMLATERLSQKYISTSETRITEDGQERNTEYNELRVTEG